MTQWHHCIQVRLDPEANDNSNRITELQDVSIDVDLTNLMTAVM